MVNSLIGACIAICLLIGCDRADDPTDPTGNPNSTGAIYGGFSARDGYHNVVTDLSGIEVSAISSAGATYRALTLADGSWEIDSLPADIYSIFMQSPIYDKTLRQLVDNVQFIGVGRYRVAHFAHLRADIRDDIVHNATIDVVTQLPPDPPIQHHNDTNFVFTIRFMTRNNDSTFGAGVEVSRSPITTCTDGLHLNLSPKRDGRNELTASFNKAYLQSVVGKDIQIGQTFYFAIRPHSSRYNDSTQTQETICHEPLRVQVTL